MLIALCFAFSEAILYFVSLYIDSVPFTYYYLQVIYVLIVTYAIVSHQLMDISIVIRRTLIYSFVSVIFTALSLFIMGVMSQFTAQLSRGQFILSTAISAFTITLLAQPILRKAQHVLQRLFPRESIDPNTLREATSGFAHEIKRPLAAIALPAELSLMDVNDFREGKITAEEMSDRVETRLQGILKKSMEAGRRIEALGELANPQKRPMETIDLIPFLERVIAEDPSLKGVDVSIESTQPIKVHGREHQLQIVLGNLFKNSVEAITEKPQIKIAIEQNETTVTLRIQDNGPGIPAEVRDKLFNANISTKGSKGMGIGLYICRQLMEAQGGSIRFDKDQPTGSTFILTLKAHY